MDDIFDLEKQIVSLKQQFDLEIENCFIALEKTIFWYEDIIFRAIENLDLTIDSFETYIMHQVKELAGNLVDDWVTDSTAGFAHITFNVQRIGFDFLSLTAQILQIEIVIEKTIDRIFQAIEAIEAGVEALIKWYEDAIKTKEDQIAERQAFDGASGTPPESAGAGGSTI